MLDAGDLDAVLVALPHHLHAPAIAAVAAAGLDIISEKPLAISLEEIDAIDAAVTAAGVRLAVVHNWMFNPEPVRAIEVIAAGLIGEPRLVRNESLNGVAWASRDPSGEWRSDRARAGGGIVIDAVYHPIYVTEAELMSPVVRVYASVDRHDSVESRALVLLEHANGGASSIQRSSSAVGGGVGVHEVHGTTGSIRFRQLDPLVMNQIFAGNPPPPPAPGAPTGPALEIFEAEHGAWRPLETAPAPWWGGIQEVLARTFEAWASAEAPPADLAAARHVLTVIEAIYRSADRSEAVEVPGAAAPSR